MHKTQIQERNTPLCLKNYSSQKNSFTRVLLVLALFLISSRVATGQIPGTEFKTMPVDKKIDEFPDIFDLSSPLSAYITFNHLALHGKENKLGPASSQRFRTFFPGPNQADAVVSEKKRRTLLHTLIHEVIRYKDSVACVISRSSEEYYSIRYMSHEGDQWLNAGEDMGMSLEECRTTFTRKAALFDEFAQRIRLLTQEPTDPSPFLNYLKKNGQNPKTLVLDALARHRLVLYGEIHRRQWSWDFCRSLLVDKMFPESTGTVYMEISAHNQVDLDTFLSRDHLEPELVLRVLREIQNEGWPDRGMFEFLCDLWRLNRTLPPARRIKVVAVDIRRPYGTLRTKEELQQFFETAPNRNAFMAETIERDLRSKRDARHCLFIVGTLHVYRTAAPGFASTMTHTEIPSAGALLAARLPRGDVYSIFTHQAIMDNHGRVRGRIRGGVFDKAFALNGNSPVAFTIDNSPFGKEPFDALPEISYRTVTGTFADNYDAYLFLGPLEDEPADYLLAELYSEDFVQELRRRAALEHKTLRDWFGVSEDTREAILGKIRKGTETRKYRWTSLPTLGIISPRK